MVKKLEQQVNRPIILTLFDYSLSWSRLYAENGYRVVPIDLKYGIDIMKWDYKAIPKHLVVGILAAPPCTDFAGSGAHTWKEKDRNGSTAKSVKLVKKTLEIFKYFNTAKFKVMEQPIGRIRELVPEVGEPYYFQPYEFGDNWTKKTVLYGKFRKPKRNEVKPKRYTKQGSPVQKLGGKSERTKELRSITPPGFAKAFYQANH